MTELNLCVLTFMTFKYMCDIVACTNERDEHYLTNKSGCAKKSAYISNNDLLSKMKVGRTTCEI